MKKGLILFAVAMMGILTVGVLISPFGQHPKNSHISTATMNSPTNLGSFNSSVTTEKNPEPHPENIRIAIDDSLVSLIRSQIQGLDETGELEILLAQLEFLKRSGHYKEAESLTRTITEMLSELSRQAAKPSVKSDLHE